MITVEDYVNCWKSYGLNNVDDYHNSIRRLWTDEEFCNKFKNVNYKAFWQASHELFGTDPVANHDNRLGKDLDLNLIKTANHSNWNLAHYCGVSGTMDLFLENCRQKKIADSHPIEIAEIGAGYGSFMNYLSTKDPNLYNYTGFDLISRSDDVVEVEGDDGCLSDEQVDKYDGKFNMVYSFNVFQHLEIHQIEKYIQQSHRILKKNEYCGMVLGVCFDTTSFHYGQKIDLPTWQQFSDIIKGKFRPLSCYRSYQPQHINMHLFHMDIIL